MRAQKIKQIKELLTGATNPVWKTWQHTAEAPEVWSCEGITKTYEEIMRESKKNVNNIFMWLFSTPPKGLDILTLNI